MDDADVHPADQRAGGVHAGRRVHPRRERGRRLLRRRRLLRPRHRRRGRQRQGDRRVDRRRRATDGPVEDGHPPLRQPVPLARASAWPAPYEVYSTYYDIVYPNHERQAGRPLRVAAGLRASRRARRRVRREERVGAGQLVPLERGRRARARCGRGVGRRALVDRDRDRAPRLPATAAGLFDESSFAKIEVSGAGAVAFLQRMCTNNVDKKPGSITYTQMLNCQGGIECDFTVTRLDADRFLIVTGTAFGRHDLSWISSHAPTDVDACATSPGSMACFGLWGPERRDDPVVVLRRRPLVRLHAGPLHHRRRRAVLGAARHVRRRDGLGAVPQRRVRRCACGTR